ncbi:hypothetical protein AAW14_20230 [Streptomyces hygroscopicus]|uniref:COG4315 family predicted lipoprotein n=1 Tax=Streptomyces hygroscopicus TaxID=1912 RepID=UPI002240AAE2|nr:hypothetical protein [Streptomyces hygroscopicus]MCW7944297.1 hypothetical protein [Streptomyces hygroscopicus]
MRVRIAVLAAAPLLLALAACSPSADHSSDKADSVASAKGQQKVEVQVVKTDLGPVLADQTGRTLYAFVKDKANRSNCDAKCIAVWPALAGRMQASAGPGVDKGLISGISRTEKTVQTAYNKWPLYYYVGDAAAGDINGQGLDDEWFVVGADGRLIAKTS